MLKEIAYLKLWLGILMMTDTSLIGWLVLNYENVKLLLVVSDIAAIIMIAVGFWFCIKGSRVKLSVCGDYRMDIIVSIFILAFIALLVYASIDATKHPK